MPLAPVKNRAKTNDSKRTRAARTLRNVLLAAGIMALVIGGLLLLYLWLNKPKAATVQAPVTTDSAASLPAPHKPPRDAQIGSSIQSLTSPVAPGGNVTLTLRTTESAVCKIKVIHLDSQMHIVGQVTDSGLADKTADEFGIVNWSWSMPADAALATWQADITCQRDSKTTRSVGDIVVKKAAP